MLSRFLVAGLLGLPLSAQALHSDVAPSYSASSVVNAASNLPGPLAPNAIASLYGTNLAYSTQSISSSDIHGGILPTVLPGTGVSVLVGGLPANLYYVSPTQINLLVPVILLPGESYVQVVIDGLAGPQVPIQLSAAAPALFELDPHTVVAIRPDGSLISADSPAHPGDMVTIFATGLGQTVPPVVYGELPTDAAPLAQLSAFSVTFDGVAVHPGDIEYAGIAPDFAGLYQINVRLPVGTHANPETRIGLGKSLSPRGIKLPVQP